ncbi:hypothetical protein HPB50_025860 [Hyalomma asiaticum]|uniref:Uncharacterized protein n=1 Tax=Hyalomma asiaticum TaxID=266040 RepID=A0ACB7TQR5_HYAAI|nr:hypothetical protein HPB50_025860 [Hyalomma asiaticum]
MTDVPATKTKGVARELPVAVLHLSISTRLYQSQQGCTIAGVIHDVDMDIDDELPSLIFSAMHITDIHRFGWSRSRSTLARAQQPLLPEESVQGRIAQETATAPPDASCLKNTKESTIWPCLPPHSAEVQSSQS